MEPHRSNTDGRATRRRRDPDPMDIVWLERKALEHAARWESTRRGVADILERKIRQRAAQTGERPEPILDHIPEVLDRLVARNYVNDRRAADQLVERLDRQARSRAEIRHQLDRKGVPSAIADDLLSDDETDADLRAAWRVARKRSLGPFCPDPVRRLADRQRHLGVLARRGFSSEVAHRIIDASDVPDASEETGLS